MDIGAYQTYLFADFVVNTTAATDPTGENLTLPDAIALANDTLQLSALPNLKSGLVIPVAGNVSTISFASGLSGTITLSNVADSRVGPSAFLIMSSVVIDGPNGSSGITLSAAGTSMRLFDVVGPGNLTLQNLTLEGGIAQGSAGAPDWEGRSTTRAR